MQIRCPDCQNAIELASDSDFQNVNCPNCGSQFGLVDVEESEFDTLPSSPSSRATIGHFELIEEVGRGSFGAVWRARDTELDRQVAIKIPRQNQLSVEDRKQFLREARAVAQLNHPNIVSVHEVGREGEQIYIVSDFIKGVTLAEKLTAKRLSQREAVELCVKIAVAVEHAHENGVIHRDLKTANIMLTQNDEPHVMDFGLAKREAGEITMTFEGKLLGTPAYMPPEQARGEGHHVDRRGDVYSLGVILYELLSGELPFRGATQMMLYQVIHDEAPSPRKLNSTIPRDLATIVLKCLQKEPRRRYQTTQALADDLTRWLKGKPIEARPTTWMERSWRWCRRNRTVAALWFTAVMLLLTVSVSAVYFGYLESKHAREQTYLRQTAEKARQDEEAARILAEKHFEAAQETVDEFLTDVSQSDLLNQPQMEPLRRQLLTKARAYYEKFVTQETDDPQLKAALGKAHLELGSIVYLLGDAKAAIFEFRKMRAIFELLSNEHPEVPEYAYGLASSYNNLGNHFKETGKSEEAMEVYSKALTILKKLSKEHSDVMEYAYGLSGSYNNLGNLFKVTGKPEEAMEAYTKSLNIRELLFKDHPDTDKHANHLATSYNNLGTLLEEMGRFDEAMEVYANALAIREQLFNNHPAVPEYANRLASSYNNLGKLYKVTGKPEEAMEAYAKSLNIRERLSKDHPDVPAYASDLANSYNKIGTSFEETGQSDEAMEVYVKALAIRELLFKNHPDVHKYANRLASSHNNLGVLLRNCGESEEALESFEKAITIRERLSKNHPDLPKYADDLANSYYNLGNVIPRTGKFTEAIRAYEKAITIRERLSKTHPDVPKYANDLAASYINIGLLEQVRCRHSEAISYYDRSLDIIQLLKKNGQLVHLLAGWDKKLEIRLTSCRDEIRAVADFKFVLAQPPDTAASLLRIRGQVLLKRGDHAGTAESGEKLAELEISSAVPAVKATNLYNAACLLSLASVIAVKDENLPNTDRVKIADEYGIRAVMLLQKTMAAGFFKEPENLKQLQNDNDLDPVRDRHDFKQLVKELEEKQQN